MLPPFANISHSSFRRNPACCATSVNSRIGLFPYCWLHYLFTVRRTIDCNLSLSKSKNQSSAISCLHEKRRSLPPCVPYVTKWLFFLLIIYFVSWFFYLTQSTVPTAASHSLLLLHQQYNLIQLQFCIACELILVVHTAHLRHKLILVVHTAHLRLPLPYMRSRILTFFNFVFFEYISDCFSFSLGSSARYFIPRSSFNNVSASRSTFFIFHFERMLPRVWIRCGGGYIFFHIILISPLKFFCFLRRIIQS